MEDTSNIFFKKPWNNLFPSKWILGLVLIFLFGIPRFMIVLQSNVSGRFQWVTLIFVLMWFTPFVFLTGPGRKAIGLKRTGSKIWLLWGFVLGCGISFLCFVVFRLVYGIEVSNAFVYIGSSTRPEVFNTVFFFVYLMVSMTFSPIGEELFYRGVVHECFKSRLGDRKASYIDSAAFALTHLAHFGIIYVNGNWIFLFVPSFMWVIAAFLSCQVFHAVKRNSDTIWGAVVTHAGFNFAMGFIIFYCI